MKRISHPILGPILVTDEKTSEEIKKRILTIWEKPIQKDSNLPAPQPSSIERKDLSKLKENPYVVCHKLDGERFLLFVTEINSRNVTTLVDRNFKCYIAAIQFKNEEPYKGSLFDGEVVKNKDFIEFVIHDTISLNGTILKNEFFDIRWNACNNWIQHFYTGSKKPFYIRLKKFYTMNFINICFDEMPTNCDGLVMYPIKEYIGSGTQRSLYKWKTHHTVDFQIKHVNDKETSLLAYDRGSMISFKTVPKMDVPDDCIVECDSDLSLIKIRRDKSKGNSLYTIKKTLFNAKENITKEELISMFS